MAERWREKMCRHGSMPLCGSRVTWKRVTHVAQARPPEGVHILPEKIQRARVDPPCVCVRGSKDRHRYVSILRSLFCCANKAEGIVGVHNLRFEGLGSLRLNALAGISHPNALLFPKPY